MLATLLGVFSWRMVTTKPSGETVSIAQQPAPAKSLDPPTPKPSLPLPPSPSAATAPCPSDLLKAFTADNAFAHLQYLAQQIGPRIAGTETEAQAAHYIEEQFRKSGYVVHLQGNIYLPPVKRLTQNVIATKESVPASAKYKIVVGAHYDSIFKDGGSPGANDNASGVGVMLEVARILANVELPYALEFVAFGAEESVDGIPEHHHYGSNHYVAAHLKNKTPSLPIVGMISIDMIGVGSNFYARTLGVADPFLRDKTLASSKALGIPMETLVGKPWSDHEAFEKAGIPSVWFHRRRDPAYHTRRDRPKNVQHAHLQTAGMVVIHLLIALREADLEELARRAKIKDLK
jgi:hypothetical protein